MPWHSQRRHFPLSQWLSALGGGEAAGQTGVVGRGHEARQEVPSYCPPLANQRRNRAHTCFHSPAHKQDNR